MKCFLEIVYFEVFSLLGGLRAVPANGQLSMPTSTCQARTHVGRGQSKIQLDMAWGLLASGPLNISKYHLVYSVTKYGQI